MIDLHTHSTASDGTDSPARLVEVAARAGITTLAITDHDTTSGWPEAAESAGRFQIGLVRGAEISAIARTPGWGTGVHLLAYLHDPTHPDLLAETERTRDDRTSRARRMVDLLGQDYPITWDDLLAQTKSGTTIGRPHIADALVAAGVVQDRDEAFATMLRPGTRYYVGHYAPDAVAAVQAVRAAGGVPVFAHPGADARGRVVPDSTIEELAAAGLAGLEVDHRDHTPDARRRLRDIAGSLDLLVTGSSDFHGAGKRNLIGENTTEPEVLEAIAEQGALEVLR
ncbi:PHP domain-containing protein [Promicromonospora iranensis]|uniref:Metal-dependent phosphoesterase TrpH n=1 Tax=Promicromonospora iranensis TaxID=1105144 RepID=A0ABU2CM04_9MICO|nr:PHP domain-containing protein [Promicromonospora iranensis]MDR7382373.1 putative metal-dependent phosphoesterase TrpH [Promicromonospora iranensis]